MSMLAPHAPSPLPFSVEIPDGWTALRAPRDGVALELVVDNPPAFASRLSFELHEQLDPAEDAAGAGPIDRLLSERVVALTESMTDARFLDVTLHGARPANGSPPALMATVAYRHGPYLVTALLWVIPLGGGRALLITGLTDADMLALDAPAFAEIVSSLQSGPHASPMAAVAAPPALAEGERWRLHATPPPAGWVDVRPTDPRTLRQLVRLHGDPPTTLVIVASADGAATEVRLRHEAAINDLADTLTDAQLQAVGIDQLAVGEAMRSLLWFRQGDGWRTADVWTGGDGVPLPVIALLCGGDDDAARDAGEAWVRAASWEALGR